MKVFKVIGILSLLMVYMLSVGHNLIPHHHQHAHDHSHSDGHEHHIHFSYNYDEQDCEDAIPCHIPTHQHSFEDFQEVYLISANKIKLSDLQLIAVVTSFYAVIAPEENDDIENPDYAPPPLEDRLQCSPLGFRAPPLA